MRAHHPARLDAYEAALDELRFSFRCPTTIERADEHVRVASLATGLHKQLGGVTEAIEATLHAFREDRAAPLREQLVTVEAENGATKRAQFRALVGRWFHEGHLVGRLGAARQDRDGLEVRAFAAPSPTPKLEPLEEDAFYRLSRFALCRRAGERFVIESPLGPLCFSAGRWGPRVLEALWTPARRGPLAKELGLLLGDGRSEVGAIGKALCDLLAIAGVVVPCDPQSRQSRDEEGSLEPWALPDLLLHATSRGRRSVRGTATFPFRQHRPAPSAARVPPVGASTRALPRPDLMTLIDHDPPFGHVMEKRTSSRRFADIPVGIGQLGEFLYRVGRVKSRALYREDWPDYELIGRPCPTGGSSGELEIHPIVCRCTGVEPGLYFYDGLHHTLVRESPFDSRVRALVERAEIASGSPDARPQIVLCITARFERQMWKYEKIGYATILKDVGVLLQTMYLCATAMGLAGTALGVGDAECAAAAIGSDYYAESSVGEFLLGTI